MPSTYDAFERSMDALTLLAIFVAGSMIVDVIYDWLDRDDDDDDEPRTT